jgi:Plasmid pRiA4b ORF-3-like protein
VRHAVWRRILVPGSIRMAKFSPILLAAMGWNNSHMHAFLIGDERIGMCFDDYPEGEIDETKVTVLQALREVRRFVFEYDFGDGWEHEVVVEDLTWSYFGLKFAVCLDGENACPPDDVGGPHGYAQLLEVLSDPEHEEHGRMLEWARGPFDSTEFDLANTNALLQKVR